MATLKRWNGTEWRPVGEDTYVRLEDYTPGGGGTLTEDPARPGTFVVSGGLLTENPSRPGTFLIGA
ncbi:hypothetical protein SEA_MALISHA_35 [Gordonia phage Malisha]|nr:hypothetical protein SEA_MALISHA_35 [Gordonia phage Malisha]